MTEDVQIETEKNNNEECPQLNSQLYELSLMESPISAAEQRGFRIVDGKVFVLLVLQDEAASIPEGFDITVGTRSGAQVQALVTFSELCDLANTDEVIAIRQPLSPVMD